MATLRQPAYLPSQSRASLMSSGTEQEGTKLFSMNNWRQSGIVTREARPRDLEAIARLENEAFETDRVSRRSLREFLRAPHRPVIAATIDDELAGYVLVSLRKGARALRIYSLAVDSRFARRGVGRALLQACEAYARRRRRAAVTLEVRYDNAAAIALYESCGFRQFGEHAHYYADGAAALRYEKPLLTAPQRERGNNLPRERVRALRGASRPR
jgi:[ribosomal protein S18]-alanine N-acetyltransferase